MGTEPSPELRRDLNFLVCILGFIAALGLVFLVQCWNPGCAVAWDGYRSAMISQLSQATKAYELDFGAYPPGDGRGSADLRKCLSLRGGKCPYFEFPPDQVNTAGDIRRPVDDEKIVHYRCPGVHNPKTFDLWCEDSKGRPDGISNWEK